MHRTNLISPEFEDLYLTECIKVQYYPFSRKAKDWTNIEKATVSFTKKLSLLWRFIQNV